MKGFFYHLSCTFRDRIWLWYAFLGVSLRLWKLDLYKEIPRWRIFHIRWFQFFAINNKVSVDVYFSVWSFLQESFGISWPINWDTWMLPVLDRVTSIFQILPVWVPLTVSAWVALYQYQSEASWYIKTFLGDRKTESPFTCSISLQQGEGLVSEAWKETLLPPVPRGRLCPSASNTGHTSPAGAGTRTVLSDPWKLVDRQKRRCSQ